MDDLNNNFIVTQLQKTLLDCLYRSLNISLNNNIKFFEVTFLDLVEQIIQRHLGLRLFQKFYLVLGNKCLCKRSCFFIRLTSYEYFSRIRNIIQTKDLNRLGRTCFFHTSSLVIHHRSYTTMSASCCDRISYVECTFLYKNSCNRSLTFIKLSLDHKTTCGTVRVRFQFHNLCCQKDHLKKILDSFMCMR